MTKFDCVLCGKEHTNIWGWKLRDWEVGDGIMKHGWGCLQEGESSGYPEFIPNRVKEERPRYLKSMIQSHRGGELSKEFVELYPERTKGMVKAGVITDKQVRKAKPIWKDIPGYQHLHKTQ